MSYSHKPNKQNYSGKDGENGDTLSNNLWVGNLTSEVTDSDLMNLFAKYGALDSVVTYSSRSYAFVYFKHVEDAKVAKDALQGAALRGSSIKIQFARPAKPSKSLWVGGIGLSVLKETLQEEFLKYGKIEDFKFFKDRNTALVHYSRLEDASQAMRNMNGSNLGGDQIRVDFLRSQPSRRDQWPDFSDIRDGQLHNRSVGPPDSPWMLQESSRNYSESIHSGSKRPQPPQSSGGRKGDGQPSNVLWVGYPPSVLIDEQMLHRAMILFGEIERIKSFPSRHYSFVEFRSVDEARRAKEGLQGRLFNDPRISIMFSSSGLAPGYPGIKGPRADMFVNDLPFRPGQMDIFAHNRPMLPNSFSGPLAPSGLQGTTMSAKPFPTQQGFDPLLPGPEFNDLANTSILMGSNWRRSSPPGPGLLPLPTSGVRPPIEAKSSAWDVLDANQFQRESKRSRIDGAFPIDERKLDDRGFGLEQPYGFGSQLHRRASGPSVNLVGKDYFNPIDARAITGGSSRGRSDNDHIWRGIIAKGGSTVCNARCVPMGNGLEFELPEVVNCSARTGLELLAKHYAEAIGFDIVFFLPDSEDDFDAYTEFLRYLGDKDRAGVAKFDDGTTLFLVPPSEFLTKVLKITGPERLYGVVLKMEGHVSNTAPMRQQSHHLIASSQYISRQQVPPQAEYGLVPQEEQVLPLDYNRALPVDSKIAPKPVVAPITETLTAQSVTHDYPSASAASSSSQSGVTLTPELIATLASLIPANTQSSESGHLPLASSTMRPPFAASSMPDKGLVSHRWEHEYEASEQTGPPSNLLGNQYNPQMGHQPNQLGNLFNPQTQLPPQYQNYPTASNLPSQPAQAFLGSSQIQDPTFSLPPSAAISSWPSLNSANSSQGGHLSVLPQANHQYQFEGPHNSQKGFGMAVGTDGSGFYGSPVLQQSKSHVALANKVQHDLSQSQSVMPVAAIKDNPELPIQVQQLQSALYGAGQGTTEVEADKNQRYQSTLQFAASLLLQIQQQQQQQQPPPQMGQGSGDQQ